MVITTANAVSFALLMGILYFKLRERGAFNNDVALCISDHHDAPSPWLATASFVYVRGHGPRGRYRGHYRSDTLARWKRWLLATRRAGRTAYVYFDNDQKSAASNGCGATSGHVQELENYSQSGLKYRDQRTCIPSTPSGTRRRSIAEFLELLRSVNCFSYVGAALPGDRRGRR